MPTRDDLTWTAHGPFYGNVPVVTAATTTRGTISNITVDASTVNINTSDAWPRITPNDYTAHAPLHELYEDASAVTADTTGTLFRLTVDGSTIWYTDAIRGTIRYDDCPDFAAGVSDGNADGDECGAELEEAFEAVFAD